MPGECSPPTAADWAQNAADHAREDARKNGTTIAKLEARVTALETKTRHWGLTDGEHDPTVQLRREVGTLVRAARRLLKRNWAHGPGFELQGDLRAVEREALKELNDAVELFAGDYT